MTIEISSRSVQHEGKEIGQAWMSGYTGRWIAQTTVPNVQIGKLTMSGFKSYEAASGWLVQQYAKPQAKGETDG